MLGRVGTLLPTLLPAFYSRSLLNLACSPAGPLRQLVANLKRQHDQAVLARKRTAGEEARSKLAMLPNSVLGGSAGAREGAGAEGTPAVGMERRLEQWIRGKTQECEIGVMLDVSHSSGTMNTLSVTLSSPSASHGTISLVTLSSSCTGSCRHGTTLIVNSAFSLSTSRTSLFRSHLSG